MDKPSPQIPLSAFEELVAQYHHRLLSLEADLKDRAKSGALSPASLSKRVRRLKEVHRELNALQRLCIAEKPGKLTSTDIGLPMLDECSAEERQVVEGFLEDRELDVLELEAESGKVYSWLQDAIAGRTGALRATLRLSKLRAFITSHEKRAATLAEESKSLNLHVDKLLTQTTGSAGREAGKTTLEGLMDVFTRLESTISRVAKLKASVKREEAKTKAMEEWITAQEQRLSGFRPTMPPPTPLSTVQAARAIPAGMSRSLERARRRRDLVERFWDNVVGPAATATRAGATGKKEPLP